MVLPTHHATISPPLRGTHSYCSNLPPRPHHQRHSASLPHTCSTATVYVAIFQMLSSAWLRLLQRRRSLDRATGAGRLLCIGRKWVHLDLNEDHVLLCLAIRLSLNTNGGLKTRDACPAIRSQASSIIGNELPFEFTGLVNSTS